MTRKATPEQFRVSGDVVSVAEDVVFEEVDGRMTATVRVLKAGTSKNRRSYSPAVVKKAVESKFFDGSQMFVNHDRTKPYPQQRSLSEMVSAIESTSWDEEDKSLKARVEFFDRAFYDYAQRAKNYMGVSINALVKGNRRTVAGEVHEEVTDWVVPRSVDWVTTPAAGGAILAFEDEEDETVDWSKVTIEDIKANAKEIYEAIAAEVKTSLEAENKKGDDPAPTADEIQKLIAKGVQESLEQIRKEEAEANRKRQEAATKIRDAFAKSGLPDRVRTRVMAGFEGLDAFDEAAVTQAIEDAKEELKALGIGPRITGMGPSGSGEAAAGSAKTFSIHESVKASFKVAKSDDAKGGAK